MGVYFLWWNYANSKEIFGMPVRQDEAVKPAADEVLLITSGDLRLAANRECWPAQRDMEAKLLRRKASS